MNAVEHIVECYFRYCRNCFTMTDVKVIGGNNRQCDLLAFNLVTQEQFHVESSVTHDLKWLPSDSDLCEIFDKKFCGIPPKREGARTDHAKGKTYFDNILRTYESVGFAPQKVQRVFITWGVRNETTLQSLLTSYAEEHDISIQVYLFRDQILPKLMEKISTSNYEDEVLRILSLLVQRNSQIVTNDQMKLLVTVESVHPHPQYGSAEGLIEMSDDFDAPLEDFKEYQSSDK